MRPRLGRLLVTIALLLVLAMVVGYAALKLLTPVPRQPVPTAPASPVAMDATPAPATPEATAAATPTAGSTSTAPLATATLVPAAGVASAAPATPFAAGGDPYPLISPRALFGYLQDLTAIRPNRGWRSSATGGEAEALDYVAKRLGELKHLQSLGLALEREKFNVFLSTEIWQARLQITVDGQEVEVPAGGIRGMRDAIPMALAFDSDGAINDSARNPLAGRGPAVVIRTVEAMRRLKPSDLEGKVIFLDYAMVDYALVKVEEAATVAAALAASKPAGIVLVTELTYEPDRSHGSLVSELNVFTLVKKKPAPPILYARLEDLARAGIKGWDDLGRIKAARLTWDADVFSPATSGNLVARIPGADPSKAVILGAHIDSPNTPGAMDDGSGSAILLEVARVLDAARTQPPVDLYLVWFGSEELVLYGSCHFAATHQALLDRTLGMLQIDCLTRPVTGLEPELTLAGWSYGRLGDERLPWLEYLAEAAARRGLTVRTENRYEIESDNTAFAGFGVPNANLMYMDRTNVADERLHYSAHIHDPYDTVELARQVRTALEQMAQVALVAAVETGSDAPGLRVAPQAERRAVFVASHTEVVQMTPATLTDLGMALAWEGYDVDLVPYRQPVTAADLEGAALVVVLPVIDYPCQSGNPSAYDEAWTPQEVSALEAYVAHGGFLVLANSAYRLKEYLIFDANEDWGDANALASRFGVTFRGGTLRGSQAEVEGDHALVRGLRWLDLFEGNGVPFDPGRGQVLARADGQPAVALVEHGLQKGRVLVLADVAILGGKRGEPANLPFWQNLARYATSR